MPASATTAAGDDGWLAPREVSTSPKIECPPAPDMEPQYLAPDVSDPNISSTQVSPPSSTAAIRRKDITRITPPRDDGDPVEANQQSHSTVIMPMHMTMPAVPPNAPPNLHAIVSASGGYSPPASSDPESLPLPTSSRRKQVPTYVPEPVDESTMPRRVEVAAGHDASPVAAPDPRPRGEMIPANDATTDPVGAEPVTTQALDLTDDGGWGIDQTDKVTQWRTAAAHQAVSPDAVDCESEAPPFSPPESVFSTGRPSSNYDPPEIRPVTVLVSEDEEDVNILTPSGHRTPDKTNERTEADTYETVEVYLDATEIDVRPPTRPTIISVELTTPNRATRQDVNRHLAPSEGADPFRELPPMPLDAVVGSPVQTQVSTVSQPRSRYGRRGPSANNKFWKREPHPLWSAAFASRRVYVK
jgi:hypothetical protein